MSTQNLKKDINSLKNLEKAKIYQRFFKTGKGEYGEGDIFLGLTTPQNKTIIKKYSDLNFSDIEKLLHTKIHEYRSIALGILVTQFQDLQKQILRHSDPSTDGEESHNLNSQLKKIYDFYLANTKWINNWDLVDVTAPKIVGAYLLDKNPEDRKILYSLARSNNLWERRIAILATFTFLKNKDFTDTLQISQILLLDKHDLIHKAVGWMLREIGKIDQKVEENFLMEHGKQMPRTMLRYAIEKFDEEKRQFYLSR